MLFRRTLVLGILAHLYTFYGNYLLIFTKSTFLVGVAGFMY